MSSTHTGISLCKLDATEFNASFVFLCHHALH
jgi:hypothetical protein